MSTSTEWNSDWSRKNWCTGPGLIVEGVVKATRMHSIFLRKGVDKESQEEQLPSRFLAIILEIDNACKRNFDQYGVELPPKTVRAKALSKGHLNYYEKLDAEKIEKLTSDQILGLVGKQSGKPIPPGLHDAGHAKLHPKVANIFEFWGDVEKFNHKEFNVGDSIRLKTIGDSIFIDSFAKLDSLGMPNFTGDAKLGSAWTNKIMTAAEDKEPHKEPEGVDDSEWD